MPFSDYALTTKQIYHIAMKLRESRVLDVNEIPDDFGLDDKMKEGLYRLAKKRTLFDLDDRATPYAFTIELSNSVQCMATILLLEIIESEKNTLDSHTGYNGATFLEHLTCVLLREHNLKVYPSAVKPTGTSHDGGLDFHGTYHHDSELDEIFTVKTESRAVLGQSKVGGITAEHRRSMIYCWNMCTDSKWRKQYAWMILDNKAQQNRVICIFSHLSSRVKGDSYESSRLKIYELDFHWFQEKLRIFLDKREIEFEDYEGFKRSAIDLSLIHI